MSLSKRVAFSFFLQIHNGNVVVGAEACEDDIEFVVALLAREEGVQMSERVSPSSS